MNILLLRPDPGNERFGLGPFFRVEPLGLEYIGAALLQRGHDVTVADLRLGGSVASWIRRTQPRVVGLSGMHALEYDKILETAHAVRRESPEAFVLAGGHAAAAYSGPLETEDVDAICVDDGEEVVPALVDALEKGRPVTSVPALRVREKEGWISTPPLEERTSLDQVTLPARDLV